MLTHSTQSEYCVHACVRACVHVHNMDVDVDVGVKLVVTT
jgi:hypothetical protein